ncbi:cobyrinic acid -diamide synthase [Leptolyngbya sp. Heron Island J]|uniref:cobyrinate a,c-diamide synthase n=1 Tax=Leptolyngbya sp. Heron Island J TaxID=1385935 RepID=UPI0003B9C855|nr:cobyrinate a,c-diamide synthase [Leptolyngbya sp. Heron Island J]ESA38681.1 cobyrinic acid -diamide synthase [Leptolyngbya sp. Heron Island J]
MPIPTLVIAGTHSGVGKTSIAIGLMRAFANQGLQVQAFKAGPDFIDPSHHQRATGRVSHNLDGWMLSQRQNLELFNQACQGADLAIVEGVMGLFDGYGAESEAGSTAEMAKWLGAPVILVINAGALGRSAAALISGYHHFDPDLTVAGVICNQIGSKSHLERIDLAVSQTVQVPILGGIPRTKPVKIPERHLGLWQAHEEALAETNYLDTLAQLVTDHLDLEELINIAQSGSEQPIISTRLDAKTDVAKGVSNRLPHAPRVRIGIAQDQAFCFYYAANLSLLEQAGAELVPFSPIQDALPENLAGLYIGGGYPELYAEQLSENREMCAAIATFCQSGQPVYGECGGLMYLSQGLLGAEPQRYPFVGILPFWTQMGKRVKLGYRQVDMLGPYRGFPNQGKIRGHRFHYSDIVDAQGNLLDINPTAYELSQKDRLQFNYKLQGWHHQQTWEGYQVHNVLASYVHLHFGSNPTFAQQFVQFCSYATLKKAPIQSESCSVYDR